MAAAGTGGRGPARRRPDAATRELLERRLAAQWISGETRPATTAHARGGAGEGGERPRGARAGPGGGAIAAVMRHLLAVQAQDFGQAIWALGLRAPGSTRNDVAAALDSAQVVRSWPLRGTLHFTTPDDLRGMLALTSAKTVAGAAARHRQLEIDEAAVASASDVARAELRGGGSASRAEFFALLEADGIRTAGQRGVHFIWLLAHSGLICWGPTRGTQQALVLLDEWAPPTREPSPEEALAEFVLRYFASHGPATLKDFCWWSKTTVADAKRGLALVRDRLVETELAGTTYWSVDAPDRSDPAGADPAHPSPRGSTPRAGVHALPGFDEYLLGYQDRSAALPAAVADRVVPGNNGMFLPMIVSRGEIVGTWRRAITATKARVTAEPFRSLSGVERAGFAADVKRYGRFLGVPAEVVDVGAVDVDPVDDDPDPTTDPSAARLS